MSIVKAKLQQQNAEFISIREALELLSQEGDGCTLPEAAQYLLQRLQDPGAPASVFKTASGLLNQTSESARSLLVSASSEDFWRWEDDDIPF